MARVLNSALLRRRRRSGGVLLVVSDTFTRADSASSLGTADTGQAWTANAGTWGISSNKGYVPTPSGANDIATVDSGKANGSIQVTLTAAAMIGQGVVIRFVDTSNYVYIFASGPSTLTIGTDVAGSFNTIATASPTWNSGDVLLVTFSSQNISAFVNGALQVSTTSAVNQAATKHGLLSTSAAAASSRWDNLTITVP